MLRSDQAPQGRALPPPDQHLGQLLSSSGHFRRARQQLAPDVLGLEERHRLQGHQQAAGEDEVAQRLAPGGRHRLVAEAHLGLEVGGEHHRAGGEVHRPGQGNVAGRLGLGQDLLHACIRLEWLAFLDTDGGQQAEDLRILCRIGFFLDDLVDLFEEGGVLGVQRVERLHGDIDPVDLFRLTAQGVQAEVILHVLDHRVGFEIFHETAHRQPMAVGVGLLDDITVGDLTLVTRRHHQVLATLALVRSGITEIGDIVEPGIIDDAEHVGRRLHDHGAILQIDPHEGVDHRGIAGQQQPLGVEPAVPVDHGLVIRPPLANAIAETDQRRRRRGHDHGLHGARKVEMIPDLLRRCLGRHAIDKLQRSKAGLGFIRCNDVRRNVSRHFHLRGIRPCRCQHANAQAAGA